MIDTHKIRELLEKKFDAITNKLWKSMTGYGAVAFEEELDRIWVEYLNGIDCIALSKTEIIEDLEDIVNLSSEGRICVGMGGHAPTPYILMPKELAELTLVLGDLPESWDSLKESLPAR